MSYENVEIETRGKVGIVRLNRPQALNALNSALIADLSHAIDAFEAAAEIGCIVITGSEKAFAAGADIKEMADKSYMDAFMGDFAAQWARVVPLASLLEEAVKIAETIASMSLPSVMVAKESINRAFEVSLAEGVRFERRVFHSLFATEDQKEGMAAFVEKRAPDFKNR